MQELLLLLVVAFFFSGGFLVMKRLDCFLAENKRAASSEQETEPACIVLDGSFSEQELLQKVQAFRSEHPNMVILLRCEKTDSDLEHPVVK